MSGKEEIHIFKFLTFLFLNMLVREIHYNEFTEAWGMWCVGQEVRMFLRCIEHVIPDICKALVMRYNNIYLYGKTP